MKMDETKNATPWGPTNPHPLSRMRTELAWDGKYDEYGRRCEMNVDTWAMSRKGGDSLLAITS